MLGEFFRSVGRLKLLYCIMVVSLFLSLPKRSYPQDFTAQTLGDYGSITVMEVTGNYDALKPDGTLHNVPREIIAKEFFRTHKDEYDFLIIFSNFDFKMPEAEAEAFYLGVKNDTRGIGKPLFDYTQSTGSNGKLQGIVDMGYTAKLVMDPLNPGFEETLYILDHELLHRWGAYVKFRDANGAISTALLGRDGAHWSYLLDSYGSVLYGSQWQNNNDGSFTSTAARKYYSPLDLYLMGFIDKSQVPPMLLIESPHIDPTQLPKVGSTITGTPRYVTIDDIIAAEGERIPGVSESQQSFSAAFIFITTPGTYTGDELYGLETVRDGWQTRFSIVTDGRGLVQVAVKPKDDTPTNPGVIPPPANPRTLPPSINDGVTWLVNSQQADGSWMDLTQTRERDTAEVVFALRSFGAAEPSYTTGLQWLSGISPVNIDYLSRKIAALSVSGQDVGTLVSDLLSRQNADGGWGSGKAYMSNTPDTALALKTLAAVGYTDQSVISKTIDYLKTRQNADGGWGSDDGSSTIEVTANVLSAFSRYRNAYQLQDSIAPAIASIMQKQNPDGGFGNSPSTIYDSARAVLILKEFDAPGESTDKALAYILAHQSENGSWYESPYQTALAVNAVWKATVDPDLAIKNSDITFTPSTVTSLPATVTVTATIANTGRTDVPQATIVLYEGTPAQSSKAGEQTVAVAGQSTAVVTFPVTIRDGNEHWFFIALDPDNLVKESNEANNAALNIINPEATYDFEIHSSDVTVSQNPVDIYQNVAITSKITNRGTMNAYNVQVKYYLDEPGAPFEIATQTVQIPANTTISNEVIWKADKAGTDLPLIVLADPFDTFTELSEANNRATTSLTVNGSTDPNLAISYKDIVITPSPANDRGNAIISAVVKNNGFSAASNIAVSFYKGVPGADGILIGTRTILSLGPGESAAASVDWLNIQGSGERIIYVQVDPAHQITEVSEDDNDAFVTLAIRSLPDLAVSSNALVLTPATPKEGDSVSINVTVQNRGEQGAANVLLRMSEGGTVIGSQIISSIAGNSQAAVPFTYATAGKKGSHQITVVVDPDSAIMEQSKENNSASRSFGVQDANLWLTERYISPNGDGIKDNTQFSFRLDVAQTVQIVLIDEKGAAVRTFSGIDFENTTGGMITWDGLNDEGTVVDDGDYQIQVVDTNGRTLGSLLITVDTNRSPLAEAISTRYLLNSNLTCMLPQIYNSQWAWFPDESGILFRIYDPDQNAPEYPTGLYAMSPDGDDILRLIPAQWGWGGDPLYDYRLSDYALSPNGEKVILTVIKRSKKVWNDGSSQLWIVDRDGRNLTLLDSFDLSKEWRFLEDVAWSPDGEYVLYKATNPTELRIITSSGGGKAVIDANNEGNISFSFLRWSPEDRKVAYPFSFYDSEWYYSETVRIADITGSKTDIFMLNGSLTELEWLTSQKLLMREEHYQSNELWLIDASGAGNHRKLSDSATAFSVSPDKTRFVFIDATPQKWDMVLFDEETGGTVLHESRSFEWFESIRDLAWASDGTKLAFIDLAYEKIDDCHYNGYLVVIDLRTMEKRAFKVSDAEDTCIVPTSYHVYTMEGGSWKERGVLHYDSTYTTKELDLTRHLGATAGAYSIRIAQQGLDAAHIDYAALSINGRQYGPVQAKNLSSGEDILKKVTAKDNDVADAHNATIDFEWEHVPGGGRISLVLHAREEDLSKRKASPFRYPDTGYYPVQLEHSAPITVDGALTSEDGLPHPLFRTYSRPVTGHPPGYSYGYVKTDGSYLYGVLDFTSDNTVDSGRDWGSMEIATPHGSKTYVLNDVRQEYGKTSFTYTAAVNYQHKVYEFKIPLSEIGAEEGDTINVAFRAYGTAAGGGSADGIYYEGHLQWLSDNLSLIAQDTNGAFTLNSDSGGKSYLPVEGELRGVSPLGRYVNYEASIDPSSACSGRGYSDLWAMSSLLNLTADVRAAKEKSFVVLKGIAADLNFEGYKLEYADVKQPNSWNLISPPSDIPVVNGPLAAWVPPYEGTFYVKLTVWDKAGNTRSERKRVSWGLSSAITGIYKSLEQFSPNEDGIKDSFELHYRILEPVHLEFTIFDENSNLVRTLLRDYTVPAEDFIIWDGSDESGRIVPDGNYLVRIFDYEFFVEVDTTPPTLKLKISPFDQGTHTVELSGYAVDKELKQWVIEYGEGENPREWYEYASGDGLLVERDARGEAVLDPLKETRIQKFPEGLVERLVGKRFRISAEDFAGNRSTVVANLLEEKIALLQWDDMPVLASPVLPAAKARPGLHNIKGLETVGLPLSSMTMEYWNGAQWQEAASIMDPQSGIVVLQWDTSSLDIEDIGAIRIKAVDQIGNAYYSSTLVTESIFGISSTCNAEAVASNSLFEDITSLRLSVQSKQDSRYAEWTDYKIYDIAAGSAVPKGLFFLPLPLTTDGMEYGIRMTGIGVGGTVYVSSTAQYPPLCLNVTLNVEYAETECGTLSNKAKLSTKIEGQSLKGDVALKTLEYSLVKPDGRQLLRRFDIPKEGMGSIVIDTASLAEGAYTVEAAVKYTDLAEGSTLEQPAEKTLVVDHTLPNAQITYPGKNLMICPVRISDPKGDWYGIPVEGIATDNGDMDRYELYYSIGENPDVWVPAITRLNGKDIPVSGNKPIKGQLGLWDISALRGTSYSLHLKVIDSAGNVSCAPASFSMDTLVEIPLLSNDKYLFSPNSDGMLDDVATTYRIEEYTTVDIEAFKALRQADGSYLLDAAPIKTMAAGLPHLGGQGSLLWDGNDGSGVPVPDGVYGIAVLAKDSCGNTAMKWAAAEVDTTAPTTVISHPLPSDPLGTIVEVKGTASDLHFKNYVVEIGQGDAPEAWSTVSSSTPIPVVNNMLGTWNTFGLDGRWTIRLTAYDTVGNKNETKTTVDLGARKTLIKDLGVAPRLFSPNSDGRLDTTAVAYELTDACQVQIEILDSAGVVRKTYTGTTPSAGRYTYSWDGRDSTGTAMVPDGSYTVKFTAALSSNPPIAQTESVTVSVDTTMPTVDMKQPVSEAYFKSDIAVNGTIADTNILEYAVSYSGGSSAALLDQASQSREGYTFGLLSELAEGNYLLTVKAKDLAENTNEKNIAFVIDRTPPKVTLDTPKGGEYHGSDKGIITVTGAIVEQNLEMYALRYGAGDVPAQWIDLLSGAAVPSYPQLYSWKVGKNDGIPDGAYTVQLSAKDKAGSTGEARAKIIVDNTLPEAAITSLKDGEYVRSAIEVRGSASDTNLDTYTLEVSEGVCSAAFKWITIKASTASVKDGILATWQTLPPDGAYCLRLTVLDKVGNKAETSAGIKVDTHPPAAPVLSGKIESKSNARLEWTPNGESDLGGYALYRNGQKVTASVIKESTYFDQNLAEGEYSYIVTAIDRAGNESAHSNEIKLKVDMTGPDARVRAPQNGAKISGLVDIKGTAYSPDDFKQYRVYIGRETNPSEWGLIRTSPLAVAYGSLAQWDTLGLSEDIYSIKLEAEDLTGNTTVHHITVAIDNAPPSAPLLISAVPNGSEIALTWNANTESDLAGYLLYRNDQLANVSGIVVGDLKAYLIAATSYLNKALPDGKHKYYLVAVDQAGNMSEQSNALEVTIDTRPPHATIVEPLNASKFQGKVLVKAESPDTDIASVAFQFKRAQDSAWTNLGTPVLQLPYALTMDPLSLGMIYGDYHLRAIATDQGGKTDPSPAFITVTFTDLTPPDAPIDLKALTSGVDVTLTWSMTSEADAKGYYLYRISEGSKVKINSAMISEKTFKDSGLPDGTYTYEVTAADTYNNESKPSNAASAKIYAPLLTQPYTPASQKTIPLAGSGAGPYNSVEFFDDNGSGTVSVGSTITDGQGNFTFNAVLALGLNKLTARATDNAGNTSRTSEIVAVVYNEPPTPPTGLTAAAQDYTVSLTWDTHPEADVVGYNLYRNDERINQPVPVYSGTADASSYYSYPSNAFDGDPYTYWASRYGYGTFNPAWWEIALPAPELISHISILWGSRTDSQGNEMLYAGKDFEIQVWTGYNWITQAKVTGNTAKDTGFDFSPSYRTDRIRIYVTDTTDSQYSKQVRISEVGLIKENPIAAVLYHDSNLRDDNYTYTLTAVDYYGLESSPSQSATAAVGDVVPPAAPLGLTAAAVGSAINLTWTADAEPEVVGFNIYRNTGQGWMKINASPVAATIYSDTGLPNGTYMYRVTALDAVLNESAPSNDASATVSTIPPQTPTHLTVALVPEGSALDLAWRYTGEPVSGFALYRSTTAGGPYSRVFNAPDGTVSHRDTGLTNRVPYYYVVAAIDALGNQSGYSNEVMGIPADTISAAPPKLFYPTMPGIPVVRYTDRTAVAGKAEPGMTVELFQNGVSAGTTAAAATDIASLEIPLDRDAYDFALSPDGQLLVQVKNDSLWLQNLSTGETRQIVRDGYGPVWSPEGRKLAYRFTDEQWNERIGIYDFSTGKIIPLTDDHNVYERKPSWSFDGMTVAFISTRSGSDDVWIKDLATGAVSQITENKHVDNAKLSPDGTKLAYFTGGVLTAIDIANGSSVQIDDNADAYSLEWSPDSTKLAFVSYRNGRSDIFITDTAGQSQTQLSYINTDTFNPLWSPDGQRILYATWDSRGPMLWTAAAEGQGQDHMLKQLVQSIDMLFWPQSGDIAHADNGVMTAIRPAGHFIFSEVVLSRGENTFYAVAIDDSGNASQPSGTISVTLDTALMPDLEISLDDIFIYPPYPNKGEEVAAYVSVWNRGGIAVADAALDLYLLEPAGTMDLLTTTTIASIAPGAAEVVHLPWSADRIGTYTIIAMADPGGALRESNEENNLAMKAVSVMSSEGIVMTLKTDADSYQTNADATISVTLGNSGREVDGTLMLTIEDDSGVPLAQLNPVGVSLPYAATRDVGFVWNTGVTYSGHYRAVARLSNGSGILAESTASFTISPDLTVTAAVTTDKAEYGAQEKVAVHVDLKNIGSNYVIQELTARLTIARNDALIVFSEETVLRNLMPQTTNELNAQWDTGLSVPGAYSASVEAVIDNRIVATGTTLFMVGQSGDISGSITATPAAAVYNQPVHIAYVLKNNGNSAISALPVKITIIDPETQTVMDSGEALVALPMGGSQAGSMSFDTRGYRLRGYTATLKVLQEGSAKTVSTTSFVVRDATPPSISVLAPLAESYYKARFDLAALVTDDVSGLDKVEYSVDGDVWKLLPAADRAAGRYSLPWTPAKSDEGAHTISFRATDASGNSAVTSGIPFLIDITPPAISLSGAEQGKYYSNDVTPVYSASDSHLLTVTGILNGVSFTSGTTIVAEGGYELVITATDRAGNMSKYPYTFMIDKTKPSGSIALQGAQFEQNDLLMVAGTTVFSLSGKDEGSAISGLAKLEYRINESPWSIYHNPFVLAGVSDGAVRIDYRAVDRANNVEDFHTLSVIADTASPLTTLSVGAPRHTTQTGELYATKSSVITLSASDASSGVAKTEYRIDNGEWTVYAPFTIALEGAHTLSYRSIDNLGAVEETREAAIVIDNTPPVTVLTASEPIYRGSDGTLYVRGNTIFTLAAADTLSGAAGAEYRIDGGSWTAYAPFTLSNGGRHTIHYRSSDSVGNIEIENSLDVVLDDTLPVSVLGIGAPQYSANGTLYINGTTAITITATSSGSGIKSIEYRIDSGPYAAYTGPVTLGIHPEGEHTVTYYATDNLGAREIARDKTVVLDMTPPQTTITVSDPLEGSGSISTKTLFTLQATDARSGVKALMYNVDDGAWQQYAGSFSLSGQSAGVHTIAYKAVDNVHNAEAPKTMTVTLKSAELDVEKDISTDTAVLIGAWEDTPGVCRKRHDLSALEQMLTAHGIKYRAVSTQDEFIEALRSGRYPVYLLLDLKEGHISREITEAVHYGDGLVFIKTKPDAEHALDALGVAFKGHSSQRGLSITVKQSPISDAGVLPTNAGGKVMKAEITSSTTHSLGEVIDRKRTYPVITANQYGRGKVVLFSFDLINCPDKVRAGALLANALGYVVPEERPVRPLESVPVMIEVGSAQGPLSIKVTERLPNDAAAESATPPLVQTEGMIVWQQAIADHERAQFEYFLILPDARGTFTPITELEYEAGGSYSTYGTYPLPLTVQHTSIELQDKIITELMAMYPASPSDAANLHRAIDVISRLDRAAGLRHEMEVNIDRLLLAADLLKALSFDASSVRLKVDELLKVWEAKWYRSNEELCSADWQ